MHDQEFLVLSYADVKRVIADQEQLVMRRVREAYLAYVQAKDIRSLSSFMAVPGDRGERFIALPAFLPAPWRAAGVKWIASFPQNPARGLERASGLIVLNCPDTGRPRALMEGSLISASRTAASAALAAQYIHTSSHVERVGFVGAGPINVELARFLKVAMADVGNACVYDLDQRRAECFSNRLVSEGVFPHVRVEKHIDSLLGTCDLISFATSATAPYVQTFESISDNATVLHLSLRDLPPEFIFSCDNVTDDVAHVCQARTSLHIAEQKFGTRNFIRCSLADILLGHVPGRRSSSNITIFSPFGLGILDLAVACYVYDACVALGIGSIIRDFLPQSWSGVPASASL